jgi:translation initiation factor 3 subunit I
MKPIVLQGHSRPIKHLKFNETGDTLFTASADRTVISWNSQTGEKLKVYNHSAAVNTFILSNDGQFMISGDNTGTIYVWDIKTGTVSKKIENVNLQSVRSLDLGASDSLLLIVYAGMKKGAESNITIFKLSDIVEGGNKTYDKDSIYAKVTTELTNEQIPTYKLIPCAHKGTKFASAKFVHSSKNILVSREDGFMEFISLSNCQTVTEYKFHNDSILDFDVDNESGTVVTAGKDGVAYVFGLDTFEIIAKLEPTNPVRNLNTCRIYLNDGNGNRTSTTSTSTSTPSNLSNPSKGAVIDPFDFNKIFNINIDDLFNSGSKDKGNYLAIIAGGQDSKLVTTTHQKEGGFEVLGYGLYKGDSVFSLQAHFGPVNTLAINKNKKLLATGSEDSAVKIFSIENIETLK